MRVELINGFSSCHGFDTDEFPLLMPHIQPESAESYLCTPVRLDNERTHYIKGFRYDARSYRRLHTTQVHILLLSYDIIIY